MKSLVNDTKVSVSLRNISFTQAFDTQMITNNEIISLSGSLRHLTLLHTLNLGFSELSNQLGVPQITDKAVESVGSCLKFFTSLKNVTLRFTSCKGISDRGIKYLSVGLKHHPSIRKLTLDFSDNRNITDNAIKYLSGAIKGISGLREFNFLMTQCLKITGAGIRDFAEGIKPLVSLKKLRIEFYQ